MNYLKQSKKYKNYDSSFNITNLLSEHKYITYNNHNNYNNNSILDVNIYWINLDYSKDRYKHMIKIFDELNITKHYRISAISDNITKQKRKSINMKTIGTYGCLFSHIKAIQEFLLTNENICLILEDDIDISYLKYHNIKLTDLYNKYNKFDIIQLGLILDINNLDIFEDILLEGLNVLNGFLNSTCAYLITRDGANKVIKYFNCIDNPLEPADYFIYKACNTGYITRPYFSYQYSNIFKSEVHTDRNNFDYEDISKMLFDAYMRVVHFFKSYCINAGILVDRYENMLKFCKLLNSNETDFFYNSYLGCCVPNLDYLINNNIYDNTFSKQVNCGAIGLGLSHRELFSKCINNNYTLILEDDIEIKTDFFLTLDIIFSKYKFDILYLGHTDYTHHDIHLYLDKIDTIYNYDIYTTIHENELDEVKLKPCIAGFYAVILSNNVMTILNNEFKQIKYIGDVFLCMLAFRDDIKTIIIGEKNNIHKNNNFVWVNQYDISLTETKDITKVNYLCTYLSNPIIKYLIKTKILEFKYLHNFIIHIGVSKIIYENYNICNILNRIYKNIKISIISDNTYYDICIYTNNFKYTINNNSINILIDNNIFLKHDIYIHCDDKIYNRIKYLTGFEQRKIIICNDNIINEHIQLNIKSKYIDRLLSSFINKTDIIIYNNN